MYNRQKTPNYELAIIDYAYNLLSVHQTVPQIFYQLLCIKTYTIIGKNHDTNIN